MTKFTFTTRETYKAYVAEWKATYAANSQIIRDLKRDTKALQKAGDDSACNLQSKREYMRTIQRNALAERAKAKEEAQAQYLAAKALQDAA